MTGNSYAALAIETFGPENVELSRPPILRFGPNGEVSLDSTTGKLFTVEPVEVDGLRFIWEGRFEELNGSRDWRAAMAEPIRQAIAEAEAEEAEVEEATLEKEKATLEKEDGFEATSELERPSAAKRSDPPHESTLEQTESVRFLDKLRPGGPWLLSAIDPDNGSILTKTMHNLEAAEAFVRKWNGKRNLYYSVNPTRTELNKKAAKVDIAAIEYVLGDLDPNEGETSEAAKVRYLKALEHFEPRPTALIDSGNGLQPLWRLQERIALGELERGKFARADQHTIADVEVRVAAIMLRLGAKPGTQNIDRILRLPDTINLPNAKKRKEGRTKCPTKLLWFDDTSYPFKAFAVRPEAIPFSNLAPLGAASDLPFEDLGEGIPGRDESPSGYGFRFMLDCHRKGMTYEQARTAIKADNTTAGEWARRSDVDERQLERAWKHSGGEAEITRLAALSTDDYKHEREAAAQKIGVQGDVLDKLVAKKRAAEGGLQDSLALKFSAKYVDSLRYVAAWNKWYQWDGVRWAEEKTLQAFHLARDICRNENKKAAQHTMVAGVVGLARTDRRQAATTEQWDANFWLLGTPEGTVDLRTGKLSPPKTTDYITKITAVAPSDKPPRDSCPMWLTILNRITNGNEKLQNYLQRMCGYCLTGSTQEDALFFGYGKGRNGKSLLMRTVSGILKDYHETASMEMFTVTYGERHPTDLAQLRGARLVTAVETEDGKRWAEAKLKQMTGGDPITARFMRQDPFTYIPQFKLLFIGNHKPAIRNVDEAIAARMNLIPFTVFIPKEERDPGLFDKLKGERNEWPGILRWMIDGCLQWQRVGLDPPKIVADATKEYLEDQDTIQNFFNDCCVIKKGEDDTFEHIWDGYIDWCENCREFVGTKKAFGQKLKDKGFQMVRLGADHTTHYLGIRCIRENAKKMREQAAREAEEARRNAPPDHDPNDRRTH
jgi:putative DNA primase/helicase